MEKKRLYRIREDRIICGVCSGVAEYFDIDPSLVRIIWAAAVFFGSVGFWLYVIAAIVLPDKNTAV